MFMALLSIFRVRFLGLLVSVFLTFGITYAGNLKQVLVYPLNDDALGFVEAVGLQLQRMGAVEIVSYDKILKMRRNTQDDLRGILQNAQFLGATSTLVGSVSREPEKVHFTGHLFNKDGGKWTLDVSGRDECVVMRGLVEKVGEYLNISVSNTRAPCLRNPSAERFYSLGLLYKNKGSFIQAISLFQAVLDEQPSHAMARIRLAQCRLFSGEILDVEPSLASLAHDESVLVRLWRLELVCRAAIYQGKRAQAKALLDQAIQLAAENQLMRRQAILLNLKVNFLQVSRYGAEKAAALAREVTSVYEQLGDMTGIAESKFILAQIIMNVRSDLSYQKAEALIREGKKHLEGLDNKQHEASALYMEALNRINHGGFPELEILDRLIKAEAIFLELGSLYSYINTGAERCEYYVNHGRYKEAEPFLDDLLELARKNGFYKFEIMLRNQKAAIFFKKGDYFEAASQLIVSLDSMETRPIAFLKENAYNKLIPIYLSLRFYDRALKESSNLLSLVSHEDYNRERYSFLLNNHGEILFLLGKLDEATVFFEDSMEIKRNFGNQSSIAWTLRNIISVKIQMGSYAEVESLLARCEQLEPDRLATRVLEAQLRDMQGKTELALGIMISAKKRYPDQWNQGFEEVLKGLKESGENGKIPPLLPNHL